MELLGLDFSTELFNLDQKTRGCIMNKKRGTHYWVIFLFLGIGLFVTNCSLSEEENISDPITGVWKLKWQKSAQK